MRLDHYAEHVVLIREVATVGVTAVVMAMMIVSCSSGDTSDSADAPRSTTTASGTSTSILSDRPAETPGPQPSDRAEVVIVDDDSPPSIKFRYSSIDVVEGTSDEPTIGFVEVVLSHRSEDPIRFTVHTAANTASESEFEAVATRVLFDAPGLVFKYPVRITADGDPEGRQQFYLFMRNPLNATLDISDSDYFRDDRIRTKIRILDDDPVINVPLHQASDRAFAWLGAFDRPFTPHELEVIARNHAIVVLAKFHDGFDIAAHHKAATDLVSIDPNIDIYAYFNAKHWFVESAWGTKPPSNCLLADDGQLIGVDTDRSYANYLDLSAAHCREWIVGTIDDWLEAAPYAGVAFDSASPIGDFGEATLWQDRLGGQSEVDDWNAGLLALFDAANVAFGDHRVIFNGIGEHPSRGPGRDLVQLDSTDGALSERFAIDQTGRPNATILDDLALMQTSDDILLMKSNMSDNGDTESAQRAARFAYGTFLMGWQPGRSFWKFALDDFYDVSELADDPPELQMSFGEPIGLYSRVGDLLTRSFRGGGQVAVNIGLEPVTWGDELVPPGDARFLP